MCNTAGERNTTPSESFPRHWQRGGVDTAGAGDSFISGFLKGILEEKPVEVYENGRAANSSVTLSTATPLVSVKGRLLRWQNHEFPQYAIYLQLRGEVVRSKVRMGYAPGLAVPARIYCGQHLWHQPPDRAAPSSHASGGALLKRVQGKGIGCVVAPDQARHDPGGVGGFTQTMNAKNVWRPEGKILSKGQPGSRGEAAGAFLD